MPMNPPAAPLAPFSAYGIELEYVIVDRNSLEILPIADALLDGMARNAAQPPDTGFAWSNELVLHLLEVKNQRPSPQLEGLAPKFQAEVRRVEAMLAGLGARLMPGGAHPWMDPGNETRLWPHRDAAIYRTYHRIFDCRTHGWSNLQSMQLNLPFSDDHEFARLHAAVRLLLPILPALAASSPIAEGRRQAELDFRMASYRRHATRIPSLIGQVVPDDATTIADYRANVLAPMYADVAPFDPAGDLRHDWLNARGAIPRFDRHAIEIRVIDMQECPDADIAIAALASAVVRTMYEERWSAYAEQRSVNTETLAGILDRCIRDADDAVIEESHYLALLGFPRTRCTALELWRHLSVDCAHSPPMSEGSRATMDFILEHGPLARRILRAVGGDFDRTRLTAVYRELCDCLAEGRLFAGLH